MLVLIINVHVLMKYRPNELINVIEDIDSEVSEAIIF